MSAELRGIREIPLRAPLTLQEGWVADEAAGLRGHIHASASMAEVAEAVLSVMERRVTAGLAAMDLSSSNMRGDKDGDFL